MSPPITIARSTAPSQSILRAPSPPQVTPIAITGAGLVTADHPTLTDAWQALLDGHAINDHRAFPAPIQALADRAARQAIANAGWSAANLASSETALVIGSGKGPVLSWLAPTPAAGGANAFGLASLTTDLAASLGCAAGPRLLVSAACASGLHALIRAALLLRSGTVSRVLVIAAEASVHPVFLASFRRAGVLAPPGVGCRPFDAGRCGFLMSDAAASVCLQRVSPDVAGSRGLNGPIDPPPVPLAYVDRFALAADAHHLTGMHPAARPLIHVLKTVVDARPVDLVHAHGTGTQLSDPIELAAIEATLPPDAPPAALYSHKAALGHSLGAAGLISIVLNCRAHAASIVPPNVHTPHPLPMRHVEIFPEPHPRPIRRTLAIAAGFGGAMAAVSLTSDPPTHP